MDYLHFHYPAESKLDEATLITPLVVLSDESSAV